MPAPPDGAPGRPEDTVAGLLRDAAARLAGAGISTAALDAELLLRHVLGWDRAAVVTRGAELVPAPAAALFAQAIEERSRRRPLQHLTGVQAFWRHEFLVTPDVLIPRPETEVLVQTALELLEGVVAPVIVDVGTGSGCVALSLAAERADAEVHAVDTSPAALDVARGNAARLRLDARVRFHEGDLLLPLGSRPASVDLVASNPPYVSAEQWRGLEPEVRDHDPQAALVPPGGFPALLARLLGQSRALLRSGGHVLVEIGRGQDAMARKAAAEAGLTFVRFAPDLQGIPRVLVARRG
jgi:release factor glutamine methyltransferase